MIDREEGSRTVACQEGKNRLVVVNPRKFMASAEAVRERPGARRGHMRPTSTSAGAASTNQKCTRKCIEIHQVEAVPSVVYPGESARLSCLECRVPGVAFGGAPEQAQGSGGQEYKWGCRQYVVIGPVASHGGSKQRLLILILFLVLGVALRCHEHAWGCFSSSGPHVRPLLTAAWNR